MSEAVERNVGGRPPRSSRAAVVQAGLEVLQTEGLAAVTLAAVGERLGLHKVALYTYVKSKDDLLLAMRDEINRRQLEAFRDEADLAPEVALKATCGRLARLMLDYGQLMVTVEPDLEGPGLELGERFLDVLAAVGLGPRQQAQVYLLIAAVLQSAAVRPAPDEHARERAGTEQLAAALRGSDPQRFPRLAAFYEAELAAAEGTAGLPFVDDVLALIIDVLIPALAGRTAGT